MKIAAVSIVLSLLVAGGIFSAIDISLRALRDTNYAWCTLFRDYPAPKPPAVNATRLVRNRYADYIYLRNRLGCHGKP